jgi:hypothetical protein
MLIDVIAYDDIELLWNGKAIESAIENWALGDEEWFWAY